MSNEEKFGSLNINNTFYRTRITEKFRNRQVFKQADPRLILSFIPGTIVDIFVSPGQTIKQGDLLLILDAMKMQNRLKASMDGTIKSISVKKGDRVSKGAILIEME